MSIRIHTAHQLLAHAMTERDADTYLGGYPDDRADGQELDGERLGLLVIDDPGNMEAWVWPTTGRKVRALIQQLIVLADQMDDRDVRIAIAREQAAAADGTPPVERPGAAYAGAEAEEGR